MKLTEKQKRFIDYYIETLNATEAAIRAGYSEKTARSIGAENLRKPDIKKYIDDRLKELEDKRIAKAEEVLEHLTAAIRGEIEEEVVVVVGNRARKVKKQISARERIKAAELLGKRYALFTEKVNVEGSMGVVIVDDIEEEDGSDGEG